jgi:hypothetical protein
MSHAVLVAPQKHGGDSTHSICSNVGTTSRIGSPGGLREYVSKAPFLTSPAINSPEPILNIPLSHEDLVVILCLGKHMYDACEALPDLINCPARCRFLGGVIHRIQEPAVTEPESK